MKIYVLHYSKLTERKEYIQRHFRERGLTSYEFIESYNQEDLTEQQRNRFSLTPSKASLFFKHLRAIQNIADNDDYALIFEDDVVLIETFQETLQEYWKQVPADWDMIFIGDGANLHIEESQLRPGQIFYEPRMHTTFFGIAGASRCSDSYFVSNKCARRITEYVKTHLGKTSLPYDWWLNRVAHDLNLKVYWTEPTIVTQGSAAGLFKQSIE